MLGQDDHIPLAERYALVIADGLTSASGTPIPAFRFAFETDRPRVRYSQIDWDGPVSPRIYLNVNVAVSPRELQRRIVLAPIGQTGPAISVMADFNPEPATYLSANLQFVVKSIGRINALLRHTHRHWQAY